jgi:hypothetical protein
MMAHRGRTIAMPYDEDVFSLETELLVGSLKPLRHFALVAIAIRRTERSVTPAYLEVPQRTPSSHSGKILGVLDEHAISLKRCRREFLGGFFLSQILNTYQMTVTGLQGLENPFSDLTRLGLPGAISSLPRNKN